MLWKVLFIISLILSHHQLQVKFNKTKNLLIFIFICIVQQTTLIRHKSKEDDKRIKEEQIRCESDLKRVYIYASRAIQTQDQTNLNRYALVKGKRK